MSVRVASILCGVASTILLATMPAGAADMPTKAPAGAGCTQAVDGINGKVSGLGGSFANKGLYGGTGSLALPLGCEFGAQIDANAASFDRRFLGSVGGHLFWRDPAKALLGIYGRYTHFNSQVGNVRANHIGPEGELYMGRWTLQGVAGVEFGNTVSGVVGPITVTYEVKTRFFDHVNLAYYVQDNFKVFAGHRYLSSKNALALGAEYGIPMNNGVMAAVFGEGRIGESGSSGVWGGLRVYFGQKDKTLIRRHREDDPIDWDGFNITSSGSSTSNAAPPPEPEP